MRYNAFFGELPINAFKPIGGRMTLEGGGNPISAVTDAVSDVVGGVGDVVEGAVNTVEDVGAGIDRTVRDVVPGGWTTAALLAAGYYYAPEIGAYMNSAGATVPVAEVADANALSGIDLGGVGASPNTWLGAGEYAAAVPAAIAGSEFLPSAVGAGVGSAAGSAAGAAAGSAAGNSLSSMLPYMAAAQVGTGLLQADAAKEAAQIQVDEAAKARAQQQANFEMINKQQTPGRAAGAQAFSNLGSLGTGTYQMYDEAGNPTGTGTGSGYLQHQFDATDLAKGLAPNYDFMLGQGQMANQRAANMGGGAIGGNALQGLNKYTQDYAGNAYQNAFSNYQNQRTNIYNTLAGIAGLGQNAQNATNTASTNATNAATQLGVGSAAAQAAGTIGSTNALSNTANNVISNYTLASLLNQGGRVA